MSSRGTAQLARVLAERAVLHAEQGMKVDDESKEHGDAKCSRPSTSGGRGGARRLSRDSSAMCRAN